MAQVANVVARTVARNRTLKNLQCVCTCWRFLVNGGDETTEICLNYRV